MFTILIVFVLIACAATPFFLKWNDRDNVVTKKRFKKIKDRPMKLFMALICIFCIAFLSLTIVLPAELSDGATVVGAVRSNDEFEWGSLYYHEKEDAYFFVIINDWEVYPLVERKYIDKEDALAIIEYNKNYDSLTKTLREKY